MQSGALSRRAFLPLMAAAAAWPQSRPAGRRPNILIVLADDQGWGDLTVNGNTNVSTPNIDSLARDGVLFDRFFVCAVCAPTRAEFLTGRYHARGGVRGVSTGQERLNLDETTIAQVFRQAGYATGAFGKWHNGTQHPYHPNARGFDEYYGYTSGHWGNYFSPELDHNGEIVKGKGFLADDLTDHAVSFMEQNRAKPFFCYVPLNIPHAPMQVPEKFYSKFASAEVKMRARDASQEEVPFTRAVLAMTENIDWNVGRLLAAVDKLKLAEDTIIFYFSDNGPNSWRWNAGMKGRKGTVDEGGVRAPFLMRWKGRIPAGRKVPQIAGAIDLLPTFTSLAGVKFQPPKPLDGRDLSPLILGQKTEWPDRKIFSLQAKRVSVRTQRYRLDPAGNLYDMEKDPMQDRNIAAEQPAVAAELRAAAEAWKKEVMLGEDTRPYTVGYGKLTLLPSRDGVSHGGIKRSSIHPNSSYFTNWKSPEDSITWDVETGRAGRFEATLHYCAAERGAQVELSFAGQKVAAVVEAHDSPLVGAENDRTPRTESYLKNFGQMKLGEIRLEKARGLLTLRASNIPASGAVEVWAITLRRLE